MKAHGRYPIEYISNPRIAKPIDQIYADINGFTWELLEGDQETRDHVDFNVVLPPLSYGGTRIKGVFFSRGVDYLYHTLPELRDLFFSAAYTMFCSYPWADHADAYLACYKNPGREHWYRQQFPTRAHSHFVPLADVDFLDEYRFSSVPGVLKDIDVLCVCRLQDIKNVQMIASAIKAYWSKYSVRLSVTLITGHRNGVSQDSLPPYAREQLLAMHRILGRIEDFCTLVGYVDHWVDLPRYYSRAKLYLLGSLIEGKNRSIGEAMSCEVPVVCFREFNQFARQGDPILPEGAGMCSEFNPEALADTIHCVLHNLNSFSPRLAYLKTSGRRNFLNRCLDSIPYYRWCLPEFVTGQHIQNPWIDAAIHRSYGKDLPTFLYRPGAGVARCWGIEDIRRIVRFYKGTMNRQGNI